MAEEIVIISAPTANEDQLRSLIYAIEAEGKLPYPVYVTKAQMQVITKESVLEWFEAIIRISVEQGWGKDVADRLKNISS